MAIEEAIYEKLIPALTGRGQSSPEERKLLSLPRRYGGLNIIIRLCLQTFNLMRLRSLLNL